MAGRPRKATKVLELNGAFKAHPERQADRDSEPKPSTVNVKAPTGFPRHLKKIWNEIMKQCPAGVISVMDKQALELACVMIHKLREFYRGEMDAFGEPVKWTTQDAAQLRGILASFGMTPADRSRVTVPKKEKQSDGWADA